MPILFDPWERKGVYSDSLPTPTDSSSVENGDYIINIHNGKESYKPYSGGSSGLPEVTADDNGDVLTVVSGEWAKAAPSGGGGVLIVGVDMLTRTLDKTYAEITDGYSVLASQQDGNIFFALMIGYEPSSFSVSFRVGNDDMIFVADSADGYPVLQQ